MAKQKEMSTWIVKVWKLEKYEVEAKTRTEALESLFHPYDIIELKTTCVKEK